MVDVELKKKLITKIASLNDLLLLEEISRLIEFGKANEEPYVFSNKEIKDIEEAQKQYKKGQILSNEKADKLTDQSLKEIDY